MSTPGLRLQGCVLTPRGFVRGLLAVEGGRVVAVEGPPLVEAEARGAGEPIIVPGFIDAHVHGGGGHDVMDGGDAIDGVARTHARHGTTSLLATTMTAPRAEIEAALAALAPRCVGREGGAGRAEGAARVLGVHLEGPYLSPQKLGAQPAFAATASLEEILALNRLAPIRVVTLAPEVPQHLELIGPLNDAGFRVQLGHSEATYEQGVAALERGARGFTHLFNAMSGLQHRAPGLVGAALAHARHAELIPDLLHVHPGSIRAALRAIPGLYCVSDATAGASMPDGEYRLGRHRVIKCLGSVRLPDGTLAGSALTMDQALRNLVGLALPLAEASARVSRVVADYLGLVDRGRIEAGAWADLVVLDADLRVRQVVVEGEVIEPVRG